MKNKKYSFLKAGVLIMAVMLIAGIALSCDNGTTTAAKSSDKALTGITIKDKSPDKIPDPISPTELADQSFTDPKYTGTVYLTDETELATATVTAAVSAKATAAFGLASGFNTPETFSENTTLPTITLGQALYVKVTAENGSINYYRFSILMLSNNSQLATLTVAGMSAELGSPGTTWQISAANTGTVALSNSKKTDAVLEGTPSYRKATVEYALVTGGSGAPGAYAALEKLTFADGDALYVKVTAENGAKFSIYKFAVQIGRNANLSSFAIGEETASSLGKSKTAWAQFSATDKGVIQPDFQPPEGFSVTITAVDAEATVKWASLGTSANAAAEPTWTDYDVEEGASYLFPGGASDVAIWITSSNGANKRYYRINLVTKNWAPVYKGTPKLWDPTDTTNSKPYIDPIWGDEDWLYVNRVNTAESFDAWFNTEDGQHTTAKTKALWDDDGLWVYWDIDFKDYKDATNTTQTRTGSRSGDAASYTPGTDVTVSGNSVPDGAHNRDSVELFINERFQSFTTGNYGNQYRSGLPNADGTIWLSGEKGNPPTTPEYYNSITQFQIDKKVNVWIKGSATDSSVAWTTGKQYGYVIIMRAQWVKKYDAANIDRVFDADGKVKDGAEVGLELQVNACATEGTRNGILTWNGVTSQAYQNCKSFGKITLYNVKPAP